MLKLGAQGKIGFMAFVSSGLRFRVKGLGTGFILWARRLLLHASTKEA